MDCTIIISDKLPKQLKYFYYLTENVGDNYALVEINWINFEELSSVKMAWLEWKYSVKEESS